jgi:glutaredoxin
MRRMRRWFPEYRRFLLIIEISVRKKIVKNIDKAREVDGFILLSLSNIQSPKIIINEKATENIGMFSAKRL